MDIQYIRRLAKILSEFGVDQIEIEEEGKKVSLKRNPIPVASVAPPTFAAFAPQAMAAQPAAPSPAPSESTTVDTPSKGAESNFHQITSPIVGTFYRAPSPDAESYVQVGSVVSRGATLCIIEAMKLMNEIPSDINGKVVQILVENGKPVEYNQPLFLIEPQ